MWFLSEHTNTSAQAVGSVTLGGRAGGESKKSSKRCKPCATSDSCWLDGLQGTNSLRGKAAPSLEFSLLCPHSPSIGKLYPLYLPTWPEPSHIPSAHPRLLTLPLWPKLSLLQPWQLPSPSPSCSRPGRPCVCSLISNESAPATRQVLSSLLCKPLEVKN